MNVTEVVHYDFCGSSIMYHIATVIFFKTSNLVSGFLRVFGFILVFPSSKPRNLEARSRREIFSCTDSTLIILYSSFLSFYKFSFIIICLFFFGADEAFLEFPKTATRGPATTLPW